MLCMRNSSSLISTLFILPEVKDFSKLKDYDIINSGRLSEAEISDSLYELTMNFRDLLFRSGFRYIKNV